jgi:hypothetical protein
MNPSPERSAEYHEPEKPGPTQSGVAMVSTAGSS